MHKEGTRIPGIHHVTAIASSPQQNLDFYAEVLGLRLVKVTVNFDDPGTYHFYFGNELGHPGTVLTFFPWPSARRGMRGNGEAAVTAFSVPAGAAGYWRKRLTKHGVPVAQAETRFGHEVLPLTDPDGMRLELIAQAGAEAHPGWPAGPVPAEHAIRGFHGVTLWVANATPTVDLLTETLGYRLLAEAGTRTLLQGSPETIGSYVEIVERQNQPRGRMGAGTVHHVAWRAAGDHEQQLWRQRLVEEGYNVTPVRDRQYFHSIYFHEPGGVLFEIATDPPGFTLDESPADLGTGLKLPPWLEPERAQIEAIVPPIRRPAYTRAQESSE